MLFELGLFIGSLGRDRSFMLYDRTKPPALPSDLAGITAATFAPHASGNLEASLGAPSTMIREAIERLGIRKDKGLRDLQDAVQETAVEVTDLVRALQALAFKYKDQISSALGAVQPQIKEIPGLDNIAGSWLLTKTGDPAENIVFATGFVKGIVENLQEALTHSDAKQLRVYLKDIRRIKAQLDALLALPILKSEG